MKMHLNLATRDLDASIAFYSTLLGATPAKTVAGLRPLHYRESRA